VRRLGAWFDTAKRDLSFRRTRDPYAIWLSEIMLQQTRVDTVEGYFPAFLRKDPTVHALARADVAEVLGAWSGLGYYRRARALHQGAGEIVERHGGAIPGDAATLRQISGIGPYTAGAIASIAFDAQEPLVDGNVARVLSRLFAVELDVRSPAGVRALWALAKRLVPGDAPGRHNQALMELGATLCAPKAPRCAACPLHELCAARAKGLQHVLPIAKKKRSPREVRLFALLAHRGARVLLARRRQGGLFGGLWEPPMVERAETQSPESAFSALLGAPISGFTPIAEQTHVLTHRRLQICVARGELASEPRRAESDADYDELAWRSPAEIEGAGMSSLAKKVLSCARREL
jgi:A/G-specific adenine glycosylase